MQSHGGVPGRRHWWAGVLLCSVLVPAPAGAQTPPAGAVVDLTVADQPMIWRADLFRSLAALAVASGDRALSRVEAAEFRKPTGRGRMLRAAKLGAVDVPVASFFVSWNHEYGHVARATERGVRTSLKVVGTPWSATRFSLEPDLSVYPAFADGLLEFDLALEGGGLEASWTLKDRAERRVITAERRDVGEALVTVMATLNTPLYAIWNLHREHVVGDPFGDLARYLDRAVAERLLAGQLTDGVPGNTRLTIMDRTRHRALLNFVDYGLWSAAAGILVDHVWNGETTIRQAWLNAGRVRVVPSLRYALTPDGPELSVRSHYAVEDHSGTVYVSRTEPTGHPGGVGFGGTWATMVGRDVLLRAGMDHWRSAGQPWRGRIEIETVVSGGPFGSRLGPLAMLLGAKTSGSLPGLSTERGIYAAVSVGLVTW